jgi:type II secretory pathway component PulF
MARFWYRRDTGGAREYLEADDLPQALLRLKDQGVGAIEAGEDLPAKTSPNRPGKWWLLTTVYEHLAHLLEEGTSLPEALRILAAAGNARLRHSLQALAGRVTDGDPLSVAMGLQPEVYDDVAISVVAAGEAAGQLPQGLRALAEEQRHEKDLAGRLLVPLTYPFVIIGMVSAQIILLVTLIAPRFLTLYLDLGMKSDQFPLTTRLVMAAIPVMRWAFWLVIVPAGFYVFFQLLRSNVRRGVFFLPIVNLDIAVLGGAGRCVSIARICGTLGLLLRNRVELGRALSLTGRASGHSLLRQALDQAQYAVVHGQGLADSLRQTGAFPEELLFPLASAEASGGLPDELQRLAREYSQRAAAAVHRTVYVAGPAIVLVLGSMVLMIGLALFQPMIAIISQLSEGG